MFFFGFFMRIGTCIQLHVQITSNTVLLLLVYCILVNDCTCPGGPRHKPFGVSRGSPRSQFCIYCTQLMYIIFNVVIEIKFYSIINYGKADSAVLIN